MLPETRQFRRNNEDLVADLVRQWGALWPGLDMAALDNSFPRWVVLAAAVVGRYRAVSRTLAVDYLRRLSDFPAQDPPPLAPARFAVSMRVTAPVAVKTAMSNGLSIPEASSLAFGTSVRAASRLALDAGRDVVTQTSVADPDCRGWARSGSGNSCDFCSDLLGRGAVYSEASADFLSHDGCRCVAEPQFS